MNNVVNMKPEEQKNQDRAEGLRGQIRAEMSQYGLSQPEVSKQAGVDKQGASKFNQWLKGVYKGSNENVEKQLSQWLEERHEQQLHMQEMPQAPGWVKTPTAAKIHHTLTYAQMSGVSSCVFGGAGVGKTLTCEHYQQNHNNVWIVTASPAASTYPASLKRIAKAVGLRGGANRAADLEDEIIQRLKGTRGLLIIDEAQLLGMDSLWGIKHLFDVAKIGVAYVGSEQTYANLMGRKAEMNAPLFRRISKKQALKKPSKDDVGTLLTAWGLSDRASIEFCLKIAVKPGALGMVTETLRLAAFLAMADSSGLTLKYIKSAYQDLDYQG
ncbi:MAG: AAA family ATPase [Methylomarinum sp.]|nr:AAA family ATPase [Methylomarinum sp.]